MVKYKENFGIYRNNKDLIYLDYAATTFMPDVVISAWNDYQMNVGVTVNRGSGVLSDKAIHIYERSKKLILEFFHAINSYDVVFTKNATEGSNLLSNTVGSFLNPGDYILMSPYEHHSNIIPWKRAAEIYNASVVLFPLLENGSLDYDFIHRIEKNRVKVISVSFVSNVNGYLIDVNKIRKIAKLCNSFTIFDVSQAAGHMPLYFDEIDADAYVMSAHKMYGPKNVGACMIKNSLIEKMPPFLLGGGMVWNTLGGNVEWQPGTRKYEAGTFDVGLIYAWSKACEYLNDIGMDHIQDMDGILWQFIKEQLNEIPSIEIIRGGSEKCSICSFDINGMHPHDIADILARNDIEIRTGHMCAQNTLEAFGKTSLCRISWGVGSTKADIERLVNVIKCEVLI